MIDGGVAVNNPVCVKMSFSTCKVVELLVVNPQPAIFHCLWLLDLFKMLMRGAMKFVCQYQEGLCTIRRVYFVLSIALQTYVAITQAIKEVRTGGICSNRVDYEVSDHIILLKLLKA